MNIITNVNEVYMLFWMYFYKIVSEWLNFR